MKLKKVPRLSVLYPSRTNFDTCLGLSLVLFDQQGILSVGHALVPHADDFARSDAALPQVASRAQVS